MWALIAVNLVSRNLDEIMIRRHGSGKIFRNSSVECHGFCRVILATIHIRIGGEVDDGIRISLGEQCFDLLFIGQIARQHRIFARCFQNGMLALQRLYKIRPQQSIRTGDEQFHACLMRAFSSSTFRKWGLLSELYSKPSFTRAAVSPRGLCI